MVAQLVSDRRQLGLRAGPFTEKPSTGWVATIVVEARPAGQAQVPSGSMWRDLGGRRRRGGALRYTSASAWST